MADDSTGTEGTGEGQEQGQQEQQRNNEVRLTAEQQQHVDAVIARRLRESQARMDGEVERRVNEQLERSKMDAAQRAEAERDEARKAVQDVTVGSKRAVAEARVETALLAAGVKPERIDKVARLVALDDVAAAEDPKAAAAEAVRTVLADFPEFRPVVGQSGGEMNGGGGGSGGVTLEQFKGMSMEQRTELYGKNIDLYRKLAAQEKEQA